MSIGFQRLELVVAAVISVAVRLMFIAPYPSGWDDVDFALALDTFDVSRMQPHFPGYPVYMLTGHLFHSPGQDPFASLAILSAAAGGLTVVPLLLLFRSLGAQGPARLAVWIYAIAPLPLISSVQPTSDALGAFLAAWLAWFCWRGAKPQDQDGLGDAVERRKRICAILAAGVTLGLLLGVRISYAAFSLLWLWMAVVVWRGNKIATGFRLFIASSAASTVCICGVWLGALAISEGGLDSFLKLAGSFTAGHFSDWGGAYRADQSIIARAGFIVLRQIGAAGLGTLWVEDFGCRWIPTIAVFIGFIGTIWRFRWLKSLLSVRAAGFLFFCSVPYGLWAFFAQNADKPRHILPLLPFVIYIIASGLLGLRLRKLAFAAVGGLWFAGTALVSIPLLATAHTEPSPMVQLASYIKENVPSRNRLFFTWEEQRVISYMSPEHTVIRLRTWNDLRTSVLQYPDAPLQIFATNALIDGLDRPIGKWFEPRQTFSGSPWIYPTYHDIVLYESVPSFMETIRTGKQEGES